MSASPDNRHQRTQANAARYADAVRHDAEDAAAYFPALLVEAEHIAQTVAAGLHGRRRAGPGETFWQHRPYGFGDPVGAIDWRQSARAPDRLYVRQNEWEAAAAVYLWRDPSRSLDYASRAGTPTKRRRADTLAVALSMLLAQAGERIGLLGEERRPFHGRTAPERLLEALHVERFDDQAGAPPPAHPPAGARIVLFSDFFMDESAISMAVSSLAGAGATGVLVQLTDEAEETFPFRGRTAFENMEGPGRLIFGDAHAIAEAYRTKFAAHRDMLRALASRTGWSLITHRTDKPAQTALLSLYTALGDARVWAR
ncbi:MAG: DUF58 domain-containing protein [Pseudomonadota bacterium]